MSSRTFSLGPCVVLVERHCEILPRLLTHGSQADQNIRPMAGKWEGHTATHRSFPTPLTTEGQKLSSWERAIWRRTRGREGACLIGATWVLPFPRCSARAEASASVAQLPWIVAEMGRRHNAGMNALHAACEPMLTSRLSNAGTRPG